MSAISMYRPLEANYLLWYIAKNSQSICDTKISDFIKEIELTQEHFNNIDLMMKYITKILVDIRTDQQSMLSLYDQHESKLNNHEIRIVKLETTYSTT